LLPDLTEQFAANPVGSLVTVRCRPWSVEDRAVLIGDACHAVVPFYGQGMNAAFEDCTVLDACLGRSPDRAAAFRAYESRSRDANAIADLALANFVEMRDHVGSRSFLVRKWTERVLSRFLGFWYVPLYTMVSFTRIPYAEARDRARRQDRMVMAGALVLLVALLAAAAALGRR
jgi:kynurenine 3-monooxygenase